jgi:Spy/CpxP family protein refolding chaperone
VALRARRLLDCTRIGRRTLPAGPTTAQQPTGRKHGAASLGLTADQQKKMEAVFQQSRPNLMDLSATVRNQEAAMEPLLGADQPDEIKILAQIDRVAQARAELEKANARMLLGLRRILTPEQWKTLQADEPKGEFGGRHPRFGPMTGPGGDPGPNPERPNP